MADLVARARVNWGRWIADCPRPGCANAEHFGPDPISEHVGGLGDTAFQCAHCKLLCPAEWPQEREAIEALLAVRPVPATRNWQPGEDLMALIKENVAYGVSEVERV